jgi:hypothetical protein
MNKELHVAAETGGPSTDRSPRNTPSINALSEAPKGFALVPFRPTLAMQDVM